VQVATSGIEPDPGFDGQVGIFTTLMWNRAVAGITTAEESIFLTSTDGPQRLCGAVPVHRYAAGPDNPSMHPAHMIASLTEPVPTPARERAWEPVTIVGGIGGIITQPFPEGRAADWIDALIAVDATSDTGTMVIPLVDDRTAAVLAAELDVDILLGPVSVLEPVAGATVAEHRARAPKSRRELAVREENLLRRGGLVVAAEPLTEQTVPLLAGLQDNTQKRHGAHGDRAYFESLLGRLLRSALAPQVVVFACRAGDEIVAYSLTIEHRGVLHLLTVGLDYERIGRHAEYFNVLVHAPTRFAVERGLTTVDLGTGGYPQKLQRAGAAALNWSVVLCGPQDWRAGDAVRHNRIRASLTLSQFRKHLSDVDAERLSQLAGTGVPAF
jgi:hypothetical protein